MIATRHRRERIEQLAAVLDGDLPVDRAAADVRHLATVATEVHDGLPLPTMADDARDRVRDRVLAEIQLGTAEDAAPVRTPRTARSPRAVLATGLASALLAAGGVTVAAQEALPGDALYGLKKATESVRTAVASDPVEMSRLELTLATERLQELTIATQRPGVRPSLLVDALREMDARSIAGVEGLVRVAEIHDQPELLSEAAGFTERQFDELAATFRDLPPVVRPHAEDSLAVLRALRMERIQPALDACATCTSTVTPAASASEDATAPLISPLPREATVAQPPVEEPTPEPAPSPSTPSTPAPAVPDVTDTEREPERLLDGVRTRRSTDGTGLVPELPGPLNDVGNAVDDTVGSVLDGAGSLLDGTTGLLDDTLDGLGGAVDDTLGGLLGGG